MDAGGRSVGVRLTRFRSTPVIYFCADKCKMRALTKQKFKVFAGLGRRAGRPGGAPREGGRDDSGVSERQGAELWGDGP